MYSFAILKKGKVSLNLNAGQGERLHTFAMLEIE